MVDRITLSGWRQGVAATALVGTLALLSGCDKARESFGLNRVAPDEFAVLTRAPLHVPPDLRLRPPAPGTPRPQEAAVSDSARAILIGEASRGNGTATTRQPASPGETALLSRAGAAKSDQAIRQTVNRETTELAESGNGLLSRILFWRDRNEPGLIVDAAKESKRIQENIALGDKVTKGPVPVIERRQKGLLEGIFN